MTTGSVASRVPANIGNAAFLAPEIVTFPDSVVPPVISNLSKNLSPVALLAPFVRRQRRYRQSMYLITNQRAKTLVDQLMPCEQSLAVEFGRDDQRPEMRIIIALDFDDRVVKPGLYQPRNF